MRNRWTLAWVVASLLSIGCAGTLDPITVSATTAAIVGEQAVITNAHYVTLCAAKTIAAEKCHAWTEWFVGFQREYAAAHAAYKLAMTGGDITSAKDAADRIQRLSDQLILYAVYGQ